MTNPTRRVRRYRQISLILAMLLPVIHAKADTEIPAKSGDKFTMNINLSGTVVANGSCTFNNSDVVKIEFEDVKINSPTPDTIQLDGSYIQPLASSFTCTGDTAGLLQMEFTSSSGSYVTYNGIQVLNTDKNIVGIQLVVNGVPKNMGEWFDIDPSSPPTLQAELVQLSSTNAGHVQSGDEFTASGTLTMAFN